MNFTNFVSTIAVIFAVGCSSSSDVSSETPGTSAEVVVEPVSVETTPAVNEATVTVDATATATTQSTNVVTCPEGSTLVDGTCQTVTETQTSSH